MAHPKIFEGGSWDYNNCPDEQDQTKFLDRTLMDYVAKFLEDKNPKVLMDFGCANGHYLNYLSSKLNGVELISVEPHIDGVKTNIFPNILSHDLSQPFDLGKRGVVMCIEVLEHIPPQFEDIAVDNVTKHSDGYIIMSWATPGQGGLGHFNEKTFDNVLKLFHAHDFVLMSEETKLARASASIRWLKSNIAILQKSKR